MKRITVLLSLALVASFAAAQTGGITVWSKGMPPGGIKGKAEFGDHELSISHREQDGRCELHKMKADVMVIQSGTGTLVSGDACIDPVPTAPNEIQGTGVHNGTKRTVGPGDVIEIPIGVAHQFFLAPGTQITYLVVKVVKQPAVNASRPADAAR